MSESSNHTKLVVLGGGPGGYTAAFRAADLGKRAASFKAATKERAARASTPRVI